MTFTHFFARRCLFAVALVACISPASFVMAQGGGGGGGGSSGSSGGSSGMFGNRTTGSGSFRPSNSAQHHVRQ